MKFFSCIRLTLVGLFVAATWCGINAKSRNHANWQDGAQQRRADYTYMEAQRQLALESNDAYYELLKRVYDLTGGEAIVGHELGFYDLMLSKGDDEMAKRGLAMLANYFEKHPDDYYASVFYGSVCDRLGLADRSLNVWEKLHELFPDKTDVTMRVADAYLAQTADSVAQARASRLIDDVTRVEGNSLPLTARKVMSYMSRRDTVAALGYIEDLIKTMPRSAEARVYAGDMYLSMGQNERALDFYNQACDVDPSSGLAYYKRAGYYKQAGDSAAYDREVFRALELPDLELDTKLEIFTGYVREQYADTLMQPRINELFGKLIDQYPHEASVHDLYSSFLVAINDYATAAEQQEYVIDTDQTNEDRWRGLVSLYFNAREYDKAVDAAQRAYKQFPGSNVFLLLAGEASTISEKYDQAVGFLEECLANDSTDVELKSQALTTLGDIRYKQSDVEGAIELYEEALKANPANATAMNNCAYFMACEGMDLDRAAELSKRSLNIAPDNESSLDTYAWIMFKKGDYKEAKAFIDRAFENTKSPSAELYQHMGDIYFMCGEPDAALGYWEQAAELDPKDELLQRKIKHKTYFYK